MVARSVDLLPSLYETDETAWLDAMVELIRQHRHDDLDYKTLGEYLQDMARRDRREVESRLKVLITHVLKWIHQPDKRSGSWRGTIVAQRQELAKDLGGGVLRRHAEEILADTYKDAVERASAETELPPTSFPSDCPFSLEQLLSAELLQDLET